MAANRYTSSQLVSLSSIVGAMLAILASLTGTTTVISLLIGLVSALVPLVVLGDVETLGRDVFYSAVLLATLAVLLLVWILFGR